MRIIWIYLLAASLIDSMGTCLNFVDFNMTFGEFFSHERLKMLIFFVNGLIHGIAKSSVLSVLLYSAFVIRQQLHGKPTNATNRHRQWLSNVKFNLVTLKCPKDQLVNISGGQTKFTIVFMVKNVGFEEFHDILGSLPMAF